VTANKFEAGETTYLDPRCLPDMVPISEEEARALAGPPRPPLVVTGVDHPTGTITLEEGEPPEEKTPRVVPVSPNMPPGTPAPDPAETPPPAPPPEPERPRQTVKFELRIAREIADVSSRLQLAEVVANGVLELRLAMAAIQLTDLKVVSIARTDRGIEMVIEGKGPA
jgi:hypothetical protein